MNWAQLVPAVLLAAIVHALALRIAAALMVEVRVAYLQAIRIVAIEYAVMLLIAGALTALQIGNLTIAIVGCSLAYLFTGAACIGTWLSFSDGQRVGLGNGILIQAIQIPLIIPVIIVGSFLF